MARWRSGYEQDLKRLIKQLTGFKETEENFGLCLQFASSNLRFHRFLDVDSHKVSKSLQGMIEKFDIHSQQEKASTLQKFSDEFLNMVGLEGRTTGKTDTHYALLSLLLLLANSPTHATYREKPRIIKIPEPEEKFDWFAYLMEGEETLSTIYADSDSDSEPDEGSEDSDVPHISDADDHAQAPPVMPSDPSLSVIMSDASTLYVVDDAPTQEEDSVVWLKRNVTVQYWHGMERDNSNDVENLANNWERYKEQCNPLYSRQSRIEMTEIQLMREVLWMLSGVKDSFVFVYDGQKHRVRENIGVSHLTDNSLYSSLADFAKYGTFLHKLQSFTENVVDLSCSAASGRGDLVSQTYQAFCNTIATFLANIRRELTALEVRIKKQKEIKTLALLKAELSPWLHKIEAVHSVYVEGIEEADWLQNNCHRASHLLSVLYKAVLEYDTLGHYANEMLELMLPMWIQTSKPYIDIIDEWITHGNLEDPMKEFLMRRNENVKTLDEKFWETSFTVLLPSDSTPYKTPSPDKRLSLNRTSVGTGGLPYWAPQFLEPIVLKVVLAGKSMEMLQDLGKLSEVLGHEGSKEKSLYITFLESLQDMLGTKSIDISDTQPGDGENVSKEISLYTQQLDQQMKMKGVYDPLLKMNFQNIFTACMTRLKEGVQNESYEDSMLSSISTDNLRPVNLILEQCLYPHVVQKYTKVCSRLVQILKEDYRLMDYLAAMRQYFLMESGDTMFDFYMPLFDKIRLHEQWRDISTVNLLLHEAVQVRFPDDVSRLSVQIEELPKDRKPINVTDCLKLHFKVPWPVDVVINSRSQEIYNQIFTFLLQVKRAKYCLDELRAFDLSRERILFSMSTDDFSLHLDDDMPRDGRIHRMNILRMRLLYFVNSLHNYVMTRILHSTGMEFKVEIEKAQDLDQMIAIHNKYVNTIYERCLFHRKVSFLKDAVMGVLNLVLVFQSLWDKGIDEISLQSIENMEEEFTRLILFLSSFLNNIISRGSFPHLACAVWCVTSEGSRKDVSQVKDPGQTGLHVCAEFSIAAPAGVCWYFQHP
ncbi:hypothetical protein FSP39_013230 [Pinctada imbricata]|uniref:Gamma-tubulin complex component n=1 Tax=Pinctada imbricata TaxID=66713 RepID=A0AA88XLF8_PINIB|nr:hypothetical protein FSP39_013230 [Pinctada imbricata]